MIKKPQTSTSEIDRRTFLRRSGGAVLGITGVMNVLGRSLWMEPALAQTIDLSDYKAMVIIFLFGGNDSNNILIPAANHPSRTDYDSGRGVLAIPADQLHLINFPSPTNPQYGLHPYLSSMAELFNTGELSFVANVGTLVEPVPDRAAFLNKTVTRPSQLFSHSSQQLQWQSSIPDQPFKTGWAGRLADFVNPLYNTNGNVSMSISLTGVNQVQAGNEVRQYIVSPSGITQFANAGYGTNYSAALDSNGNYQNDDYGRRLKAFEEILNYPHRHILEQGHNQIVRRARETEDTMVLALQAASGSGIDFDLLFQNAQNYLGSQLKMVAKLIAGREALANQRQCFFCSVGGYDNHASLLPAYDKLMTELGSSLKAFSQTLKALNVNEKVVTMTQSEFARTMTPNREDPASAGSDHGWGGHQVVMGGPVDGGKIYGFFPSLKTNADQDAGTDGRGRWIPTTSVEQYQAIVAHWFGMAQGDMRIVFPNLGRFGDPFDPAANLGYINF